MGPILNFMYQPVLGGDNDIINWASIRFSHFLSLRPFCMVLHPLPLPSILTQRREMEMWVETRRRAIQTPP